MTDPRLTRFALDRTRSREPALSLSTLSLAALFLATLSLALGGCSGVGGDEDEDASRRAGSPSSPTERPLDASLPRPEVRDAQGAPNVRADAEPPPVQPSVDAGPAEPPDEPIGDRCEDAGGACDTCACRLCAAEVDACLADPLCEAVLECARRTGCAGLECLQLCGDEIDAAGGVTGAPVAAAQAVSDCRDTECGTDDAACTENDPGPTDVVPPPADPPNDPVDPPNDPVDPPNDPVEPPPDECADAGDECNTCACRLCADELDACFADPLCRAVVDCARRTGCDGLGCLNECGDEINAAGGPLSGPVGKAQDVSGCRESQCGTSPAECTGNDPGPPQAPMDPEDPPGPDDPPVDPPVDPPPAGGCDRFPADEFCGEGTNGDGVAWCEFFLRSNDRSCDDVCGAVGSRCLIAFEDERGDCLPDERINCSRRRNEQICRCER